MGIVDSMLVTGGGARNKYLVERIKAMLPDVDVVVPDEGVIDYKEAIIFALLGYLRLTGQNNVLSSVTGASRDSCSGDVISGASGAGSGSASLSKAGS